MGKADSAIIATVCRLLSVLLALRTLIIRHIIKVTTTQISEIAHPNQVSKKRTSPRKERETQQIIDNDYANHFANIKQLFSDIGCYDVNFFANEDYQRKPAYFGEEGRLTTIGVAISQKEIKAGGETYTLVPVAIRGGGYETEWASNVTIGGKGEIRL